MLMKALTPREEANWIAGSNLHCPKIKLNIQHSFELGNISQKKTPFFGHCPNWGGNAPCPNWSWHLKVKQLPKLRAGGCGWGWRGVTLAMLKERMFSSGKFSLTLQKKINPNRESQKGGAGQQRPMLWRTGPRGESPPTSSEIHIEGHNNGFFQKPLKIWGLWPFKTRPSKDMIIYVLVLRQ